jgi:hypothetical protein
MSVEWQLHHGTEQADANAISSTSRSLSFTFSGPAIIEAIAVAFSRSAQSGTYPSRRTLLPTMLTEINELFSACSADIAACTLASWSYARLSVSNVMAFLLFDAK